MKKILLPLLIVLLSACASNRTARTGGIYDLGVAGPGPAPASLGATAIDVRLPTWLDGATMLYRLEFEDGNRLREYATARWAGTPSQLLRERLRLQLGLLTLSSSAANCVLRFDVDDFGQRFGAPDRSHAVIRGEARLLVKRVQKPIAVRALRVEAAAPTLDAPGGVAALAAASDDLARQMRAWLEGLAGTPGLEACSSR